MISNFPRADKPIIRLDIRRFALISFILILTQPYLKFFGIGTASDNQPIPAIMAAIVFILFIGLRRLPTRHLAIYFWLASTIAILNLFSPLFDSLSFVRGMWGYFVFPIFTHAIHELFKGENTKILERGLKISFLIWATAGLAQLINADAFTLWRDKLIMGNGRGAISFSTEPAYFCLALLLMSTSLFLLNERNRPYIYITLIVSTLVAKSMVGTIYSLGAIYLFGQRKITTGFATVALIYILIVATDTLLPETRFAVLLHDLRSSPLTLANEDMSFGLRASNVIVPLMSFRDDLGIPHGIFSWNKYHDDYVSTILRYDWSDQLSPFDERRILSIHGQLLFELGILSGIIYYWIWAVCRQHIYHRPLFFLLMLLFLNGLNLSSPFFAILIATILLTNKHKPLAREPQADISR